jgi:adenosylcobinamide kinase/adenosylcobinamide-phosphate guanylyltransferase
MQQVPRQQDLTHSVTLVLGGVRSGKSRYAQQLLSGLPRVTFIATAVQRDDVEMAEKIARHRAERPASWTTMEEPLHLATAIQSAGTSDAILVDCLTLFAGSLLEAEGEGSLAAEAETEIDALCAILAQPPCRIVLVSNEVGSGVVPAYASGRQFRNLAGEIHQRVAAVAGCVVLMVAGLPLALKGQLPVEGGR